MDTSGTRQVRESYRLRREEPEVQRSKKFSIASTHVEHTATRFLHLIAASLLTIEVSEVK